MPLKINEIQFTNQVIEIAHRFGWLAVHFETSKGHRGEWRTAYRGDGKGYFDITAVRERLLLAELKVPPNKPSVEQKMWAKRAIAAGLEVYLWEPDDYDDIVKVFAGVRPPISRVASAA